LSCWDLNGNGIGDPQEDVNGDGLWDAMDCQGPPGPQGEPGPPGDKTFIIAHPTIPGKYLIHAVTESPESTVFYRGTASLIDGVAVVKLPHYFEALTRRQKRTVQLTCVDGWSPLYVDGEVEEGQLVVRTTSGGNPVQRFHWEVRAARRDVPPLYVEPDYDDIEVLGIGPYKYYRIVEK